MEFGENGAVISNKGDANSGQDSATSIHVFEDGPRSLKGLYTWTRYGLIGYMIVECFMFLAVLFLVWLYMPTTVVPFDMQTLERIDLAITTVVFTLVALFWACAFLVARFTYRAMRNLYTVGSKHAEMSPGWTVGWYFIPLANLFKPAEGMSQIVHGTRHALGETKAVGSGIPLWWTCWLLTNITQTIADRIVRFSGASIDVSTQFVAFGFEGLSSIIGIASAWALMRILSSVSDGHEKIRQGGVAEVFD
ncbi:MAG: DUF4328 domain-containing protein [Pseudomonadota bacterium]